MGRLLVAVTGGVRLGRFVGVMCRVKLMPVGRMSVVGRFVVRACLVMLGGFSMMTGRQIMMFRRLTMVDCRLC